MEDISAIINMEVGSTITSVLENVQEVGSKKDINSKSEEEEVREVLNRDENKDESRENEIIKQLKADIIDIKIQIESGKNHKETINILREEIKT